MTPLGHVGKIGQICDKRLGVTFLLDAFRPEVSFLCPPPPPFLGPSFMLAATRSK